MSSTCITLPTHTLVSVNGTAELAFANDVLEGIPYFDTIDRGTLVEVTVPHVFVTTQHLRAISNIIMSSKMTPTVDLLTHHDVYVVVILCEHFGISSDTVSEGFAGWVDSPLWTSLHRQEWIYPVHRINEDVAGIRKFIRMCKNAFDIIAETVTLRVLRDDPVVYIDTLLFFRNLDFAVCFNGLNERIQQRIDELKADRIAHGHIFMVDPYSIADYFRYDDMMYSSGRAGIVPLWDAASVSTVPHPQPGEMTIAPADVVFDRFSRFTCGKFGAPPNKNVVTPFPFGNVAFAGGAITKLLAAGYKDSNARQSDVDIFIFAPTFDERSRVFEEVLNWFRVVAHVEPGETIARPITYFALSGCVTTIYLKNVARKFQIVSTDASTAFDVVGRFDLSHIQWCMVNGRVFGTPDACRAMREKVTRFGNATRLRIERLVKALSCGYSILKTDEVINNHFDITVLVEDPKSIQMRKYLTELHDWWYPVSMNYLDPEEEIQHFMCRIEKDSSATIVTDDPNYVLNNVTISGNFDSDYESLLFGTFNSAAIMNRVVARAANRILLRSQHGLIRLTTPFLKVSGIVCDDTGVTISSHVDNAEFIAFCGRLDTEVFGIYSRDDVTQTIINDSTVTFVLPRYRINSQIEKGISCMRSQRGAAMNIEEDLHPGDNIQVLFLIEVKIFNDFRGVELKPVKFVKHQKYDPETAARVRAVTEEIDKEIEMLAAEPPAQATITYEESI
jgi:hypothetical protein